MIGMKLQQAKGLFFDRASVMSAADRATRRVLSKFGAYVRQTARTSIRKRKSISQPGQPPSSHTGLLKRNIFFVFSPDTQSVVIGPILLNEKTYGLGHCCRINPVELDAARGLIRIRLDHSHGLVIAFDQRSRRDHLGDVDPGDAVVSGSTGLLPRESSECTIGDSSHWRKHHGDSTAGKKLITWLHVTDSPMLARW